MLTVNRFSFSFLFRCLFVTLGWIAECHGEAWTPERAANVYNACGMVPILPTEWPGGWSLDAFSFENDSARFIGSREVKSVLQPGKVNVVITCEFGCQPCMQILDAFLKHLEISAEAKNNINLIPLVADASPITRIANAGAAPSEKNFDLQVKVNFPGKLSSHTFYHSSESSEMINSVGFQTSVPGVFVFDDKGILRGLLDIRRLKGETPVFAPGWASNLLRLWAEGRVASLPEGAEVEELMVRYLGLGLWPAADGFPARILASETLTTTLKKMADATKKSVRESSQMLFSQDHEMKLQATALVLGDTNSVDSYSSIIDGDGGQRSIILEGGARLEVAKASGAGKGSLELAALAVNYAILHTHPPDSLPFFSPVDLVYGYQKGQAEIVVSMTGEVFMVLPAKASRTSPSVRRDKKSLQGLVVQTNMYSYRRWDFNHEKYMHGKEVGVLVDAQLRPARRNDAWDLGETEMRLLTERLNLVVYRSVDFHTFKKIPPPLTSVVNFSRDPAGNDGIATMPPKLGYTTATLLKLALMADLGTLPRTPTEVGLETKNWTLSDTESDHVLWRKLRNGWRGQAVTDDFGMSRTDFEPLAEWMADTMHMDRNHGQYCGYYGVPVGVLLADQIGRPDNREGTASETRKYRKGRATTLFVSVPTTGYAVMASLDLADSVRLSTDSGTVDEMINTVTSKCRGYLLMQTPDEFFIGELESIEGQDDFKGVRTRKSGETTEGRFVFREGHMVDVTTVDRGPTPIESFRSYSASHKTTPPPLVKRSGSPPRRGEPWENSLGMRFVPVPDLDVLFSIWETRVQDFEAFVTESGYNAEKAMISYNEEDHSIYNLNGATWRAPGFPQTSEHPVCGVSWEDAKAFCAWLTARERKAGHLGPAQEFRLPTDTEWSAAAGLPGEKGIPSSKASVPGVFPWGNQWPPPMGAGNFAGEGDNLPDKIKGYADGSPRTAKVGSYEPNRFGLYDLAGNIWEWCEDTYDNDRPDKVLRGGMWFSSRRTSLETSSRRADAPNLRSDFRGFRCVVSVGGTVP